ncbi:hypothetical protein LCGC14_2220440, partial [marine sediment metagenome]
MGNSRYFSKFRNILIASIVPFVLLAIWEWAVSTGVIPNTIIASPSQVVRNFFELLFNGQLLIHSSVSLFRFLIGFALGSFLGLLFGVVVGVSKLGERLIAPTIGLFAPIPPIAWIPLLIIFFGIGEGSKIGLIAIASAVVIYISTVQGIRSVDQKLIEVAKSYNKSTKDLLIKVLLPSAIPNILTGMRVALGLSWIL